MTRGHWGKSNGGAPRAVAIGLSIALVVAGTKARTNEPLDTSASLGSCHPDELEAQLRRRGDASKIVVAERADKLLAEGMLWSPDHDWFLVSGRQGIFRYSPHGKFLGRWGGLAPGWAVAGLALDPKLHSLWAVATGIEKPELGRSKLIQLSLKTGAVVREHRLPGVDQWYGDLAVAPDGTVFVGVGRSKGILRLSQAAREFERVPLRGEVYGPQGMLVTADGAELVVADYTSGLKIVNLASNVVRAVDAKGVRDLRGIDGLVRIGNELVAVQNGQKPFSVVSLQLDQRAARVLAFRDISPWLWRTLGQCGIEPTLVGRHGDQVYVVARSLLAPGTSASNGRSLVVRLRLSE